MSRTARHGVDTPGEPLDAATRAFMEPRFKHDFSDVRVHTGVVAADAATAVGARAYTAGHDIVFGHGRYQPDTADGQRLLGHELTHVVQQRAAPRVQLFTGGGTDTHEAEARHASAAVVAGTPFTVRHRTRPRVQRLGIKDELDAKS